jgi:PPOX class probable F420-dependent enzyme
LRRLRNIEETGRAAVVVDRYDEDWRKLVWVLVRGTARLLGPDDPLHQPALGLLRQKYPQYRAMNLDQAEIVELRPDSWTAWRASPA